MGKKLDIVHRDDNATLGDAVRVAEELLSREKVVILTGTFLSNVGLAVTDTPFSCGLTPTCKPQCWLQKP